MEYTDKKDHSGEEPNADQHPEFQCCPYCGETDNVTVTTEADICHECGYVYT